MKRPSFQFYPADWKRNSKLRRCSDAARGAWIDILCLLHDSDEYGVCRWPLDELARAAGVPIKLARELAAKDVLKGAEKNAAGYVYTPRHAGKDGAPAELLAPADGPCWYCSRLVRDEWVRQRRGQSTRFTSDNQPSESPPCGTPKPPNGVPQGYGASSSSSSSIKTTTRSKAESAPASRLPADWEPDDPGVEFCKSERPDLSIAATVARFRDYWIAQPGVKGRKSDWPATWRNWVRNERAAPRASPPGGGFDPLAHVNRNRRPS